MRPRTRPPHPRPRRDPRRGLLRAFAVGLLALAVLFPSALGGMQYVFCAARNTAHLTCCCDAARAALQRDPSHAHDRGPAVVNTCCQGRRVQSLPPSPAAAHATPAVAPAPLLVAWLTLTELFPPVEDPLARLAHHASPEARAGPEPPLFELHRVYRL